MSEKRTYRQRIRLPHLTAFRVLVKETDLWICATLPLKDQALAATLKARGYIETYIGMHPGFQNTLVPWPDTGPAPLIVRRMIEAGRLAGVGPMAAVAGAVAESVGRDLLLLSDEVMVENGGDMFIRLNRPFTCAIDAGPSPLSFRFGLRLDGGGEPLGVCTSSATFGHSLSFGKADAVCVVSSSCALADAAATAICNRVKEPKHLEKAIHEGKDIPGVRAVAVILGDKAGFWGNAELVPLS